MPINIKFHMTLLSTEVGFRKVFTAQPDSAGFH